MDAAPAPVPQRLERAASLISQAVETGAQLVVMPEVFNTGYAYTDQNYALAEPIDGYTVTWMKQQAAHHHIHLAGSLLLLEGSHIYNSLVLVSHDGRLWRYHKHYPWAWERAYFREGQGITIADTDLGKLGLLICWDYAHTELWQQYAGQIDAMVIASCPPMVTQAEVILADGRKLSAGGQIPTYTGDDQPFGEDLNRLSAWLGVPLINTSGGGVFESTLPGALFAGALLARQPQVLREFLRAPKRARLHAGYYPQTKIVDAEGQVISRVTEKGDGVASGEMALADETPLPTQPPPPGAYTPSAYFFSDTYIPTVMTWGYQQGIRKYHAQHRAPARLGLVVIAAALVMIWRLRRRQ